MQGPEYWRRKATEYQTFADQASDETVRTAYLRLAQNCLALADRQAEINGEGRGKETT